MVSTWPRDECPKGPGQAPQPQSLLHQCVKAHGWPVLQQDSDDQGPGAQGQVLDLYQLHSVGYFPNKGVHVL